MHRLGYTRYVAQGGDVGAVVTDVMGRLAPEGLVGVHTNLLVTGLGDADNCRRSPTRSALRSTALGTFRMTGFGYYLEQATRPQTIGYSLLDSPVGLAAWMLDHDTDSYEKISRAFVEGSPTGDLTAGKHRRQHHAVLADRHRGVGGPGVLGERTSPGLIAAAGQAPPAVSLPAGFTTFPGEVFRAPAQLGREGLPQPHLLQRGRQGRPLRRLGRAAAVLRGSAGGVRLTALVQSTSTGAAKRRPSHHHRTRR